jgi:FkbM family methyltransferase
MNLARKARTFVSIFRRSPLQAWDVFQLKLENRLGRSVYRLSGRRRSTRQFELQHSEEVPSGFVAYGNYILDPNAISERPVVISAGVGEYIDFDLALLERHDVRLFLVDPTPASKRYIEKANLPANASFHAIAMSDYDGEIELFSDNLEGDFESTPSVSSQDRGFGGKGSVVPCRRVKTLMEENGVEHLDILKLDIEGAAIAVLHDTLDAGIYPNQIAAEFERPSRARDVRAYLRDLDALFGKLKQAGYRIYRTRPDTIGFQVEVLAVRSASPERVEPALVDAA